jgi:hypothetical protein
VRLAAAHRLNEHEGRVSSTRTGSSSGDQASWFRSFPWQRARQGSFQILFEKLAEPTVLKRTGTYDFASPL